MFVPFSTCHTSLLILLFLYVGKREKVIPITNILRSQSKKKPSDEK
jgi:hypothetical protein